MTTRSIQNEQKAIAAYANSTETPDGIFTVIATDDAVIASGWTENLTHLLALIHPTLRPSAVKLAKLNSRAPMLVAALTAVTAYYTGEFAAPYQIPVKQCSGKFREHAWEVMREIPPGQPITYQEFATSCGNPKAVRAAAGACAMNAAALFVPCHRVLRTDGTLGGFRYGLEVKAALLARESVASSRADISSGPNWAVEL